MLPQVSIRSRRRGPLDLSGRRANGNSSGIAQRSGPETFLGVSVAPVPPELAGQISLPDNTGLVVNHIEKASAAEKDGLQVGDVLAKLDDQILILPQQLSVLVAARKEGESVRLTLLRKGKEQEVSAVLATRENPEIDKGKLKIRDAEIVIDGGSGRVLRTFTRQLGKSSNDVDSQKETAPDAAAPPDMSERLQKIENALEELREVIKE